MKILTMKTTIKGPTVRPWITNRWLIIYYDPSIRELLNQYDPFANGHQIRLPLKLVLRSLP